ncbi:FIST signal transduction protein [Maridesulfovibrio sp. FT414]|uniref:FIST signal transduction protein n=1 Tax=Maridesulfovibrio sp. FT414 TaxID=2979469 RepID=UPI003D807F47
MRIELDRTATVQSFRQLVLNTAEDHAVRGLLIMSCDGNGYTSEELNPVLAECPVPLAGGIFPGILFGHEKLDKGTLVIALSDEPSILTIQGLSDPKKNYDRELDRKLDESKVTSTVFTMVDGLASRISSFINAMFINLGLEPNIFGGGAGSLSLERKPCLFTNAGMLEDSAVIVFINTPSSVSISHGWLPIKGPFKVTESESNVIKSLDWMPAFSIYREAIRGHSGQCMTTDNFLSLTRSYPFGLSRICCAHIIRDPVKTDANGNLICVGEVREGSFVEVMHGSADSLIQASRSISPLQGEAKLTERSMAFMVDCISRALFLEDRFEEELQAIPLPEIPMAGILTFGEIATSFRQSLEFHNKTTILAVLEEL